ncbi:MAG: DNA-binding protein [Tannerellaceae bacterium]|jgi:predicted histone-like DNA-binding protein|nr:DNA-binding protein [Tannerellaceae bacterium]
MKFKVQKRVNPSRPEGKKIQFAVPINPGKMTVKDFSAQIAARSSLTRGDVESTLTNFLEALPAFLRLGMSVQLGDLGTMRLSIQSEGVEEDQSFTTNHIKGVRVVFVPGIELKNSLKHIPFEEEKTVFL